MKIYKVDGTFTENERDTDFGWNVELPSREIPNESASQTELRKEDGLLESVVVDDSNKPINIKHINVDVKIEPIVQVINCKMDIETPYSSEKKAQLRRFSNIDLSVISKEDLAKLINPCNTETKALMSIICFAKYKSLIKEETFTELFKTVNFKTTRSSCLIQDRQESLQEEMIKEIKNYHDTKEENMLSLMMELLIADIGCNLEDIVDVNENKERENDPEITLETSDLGNSILSRDLSSSHGNYLDLSGRSSILSSIGLTDEERSIQSFCQETLDMRQQVMSIKESFQEEEERVNKLIKIAATLKDQVKETLYLDDVLHMLEGDLEKVTYKKLPFRIFYKEENTGSELNLII